MIITSIKERLLRTWKPFSRRMRPKKTDLFELAAEIPSDSEGFAAALYQNVGARMVSGHHVRWLDNGVVFDAIVDEIHRARSSVHIVLYIWEKGAASDRVVAALLDRAGAGVECRILIDAFGSPDFCDDLRGRLEEGGCEVRIFRPALGKYKLARNHRKVIVVDGIVAITGGFGIRDNWLGNGIVPEEWRDANVRFSGPAVAEAQRAFAENWLEAGGELLRPQEFLAPATSGPASAAFIASSMGAVTPAERLTQVMIKSARERIWISNAYFLPSRGIFDLLCHQASQGRDVRILAPGRRSDSKTSFAGQHMEYGSMIDCGVRIFEYLPAMLHSKTMLIDDRRSLVGSINLDPLSLNKLEEAALIVEDAAFAGELSKSFLRDCERSRELSAA